MPPALEIAESLAPCSIVGLLSRRASAASSVPPLSLPLSSLFLSLDLQAGRTWMRVPGRDGVGRGRRRGGVGNMGEGYGGSGLGRWL